MRRNKIEPSEDDNYKVSDSSEERRLRGSDGDDDDEGH